MAGHERERFRRRGLLAAERGEQRAGILRARQAQQPRPRQSARVEHVARSIEQPDDADVATPGRGNLIGQRAADAAESEQHDVGVRLRQRPPAADLRQLKRRVDPARRFGRVGRPTTTNEILRSDDPCAIATTLMPPASSAVNTRAQMPGVPTMPSPTTAITAMWRRAVTPSISPCASSWRRPWRTPATARSA